MLKNTNTVVYPFSDISSSALLRSLSNPLPSICKCGCPTHNQVHVDVLPSHLFTRQSNKLLSAVNQLAHAVCKSDNINSNEEFLIACNPLTDIDDAMLSVAKPWWNELFKLSGSNADTDLSPFLQIWQLMIYFYKLFSPNRVNNGIVERLQICHKQNKCVSSCPCNGLQIRFGLSGQFSNATDYYYWCPSSRELASELLLAWARVTIEEQELKPCKFVRNLAVQSLPVIENWSDYLVTGKIGPEGSRSLTSQPEQPVINVEDEDLMRPIASEIDSTNLDCLSKETYCAPITLLIEMNEFNQSGEVSESDNLGDENHNDWVKLSKAWNCMVDKVRQNPNTIILRLDSLDRSVIQHVAGEIQRTRHSMCNYQSVI